MLIPSKGVVLFSLVGFIFYVAAGHMNHPASTIPTSTESQMRLACSNQATNIWKNGMTISQCVNILKESQ